MEQLVRDALHEQASQTLTPPADLAGRVLAVRRRRRTRTLAGAVVATAVAVAVGVGVPVLYDGEDEPRLASQMNRSDIIAHPDQSPPRDLIAAGNTALAAYFTFDTVEETGDRAVSRRTYHLLDQRTGRYVKTTRWSFVDVASGMRTAAVLEEDLPTRRIGLLDLLTGEVERWITVDRPVAGVEFSPDGSKLLATTYRENPDELRRAPNDSDGDGRKNDWNAQYGEWYRTGFYVLDVDSGDGGWREVSGREEEWGMINPRRDFTFSHDGNVVRSPLATDPYMQYYDLKGDKIAAPANEKYLKRASGAGLSPNGRLAAGGSAGGSAFAPAGNEESSEPTAEVRMFGDGRIPTATSAASAATSASAATYGATSAGDDTTTASLIIDPSTGKRLHKVPGQQLLAWVDDKRLIAWDIEPGTNEFRNRLVLVTIGSRKTVPLSGFLQGNDGAAGRWQPVFARR